MAWKGKRLTFFCSLWPFYTEYSERNLIVDPESSNLFLVSRNRSLKCAVLVKRKVARSIWDSSSPMHYFLKDQNHRLTRWSLSGTSRGIIYNSSMENIRSLRCFLSSTLPKFGCLVVPAVYQDESTMVYRWQFIEPYVWSNWCSELLTQLQNFRLFAGQ